MRRLALGFVALLGACSDDAGVISECGNANCADPFLDASDDDGMDAASLDASVDACLPLPCPSSAPWNAQSCRCELDASACNGPGNYTASKGISDGPCCPGLHTEYHRTPAFVGDALIAACVTPVGYAAYACVEGVCGDGRCEAAEAVACGCETDCPGAVYGDGGVVP
ncbi:MAG: hypothetical protein JWN48_4353 [Myxococcaceae bacterium]|nr:hypothetical protein [Myxococcaceae bacterium]